MNVGHVDALWRYPVKSMRGEPLGEARIAERGLAIGDEVRLRVTDPTPRCVMTTLPQSGLPRDVGVLRAIAERSWAAPPGPAWGSTPSSSREATYAMVTRCGLTAERAFL